MFCKQYNRVAKGDHGLCHSSTCCVRATVSLRGRNGGRGRSRHARRTSTEQRVVAAEGDTGNPDEASVETGRHQPLSTGRLEDSILPRTEREFRGGMLAVVRARDSVPMARRTAPVKPEQQTPQQRLTRPTALADAWGRAEGRDDNA